MSISKETQYHELLLALVMLKQHSWLNDIGPSDTKPLCQPKGTAIIDMLVHHQAPFTNSD